MPIIKAEVILRIRVNCNDSWGLDCTMGQVIKQAKATAMNALNSQAWEASRKCMGNELEIVGEPQVTIKSVEP